MNCVCETNDKGEVIGLCGAHATFMLNFKKAARARFEETENVQQQKALSLARSSQGSKAEGVMEATDDFMVRVKNLL